MFLKYLCAQEVLLVVARLLHMPVDIDVLLHHEELLSQSDKADAFVEIWLNGLWLEMSLRFAAEKAEELQTKPYSYVPEHIEWNYAKEENQEFRGSWLHEDLL